jgi:hypothetical protein
MADLAPERRCGHTGQLVAQWSREAPGRWWAYVCVWSKRRQAGLVRSGGHVVCHPMSLTQTVLALG